MAIERLKRIINQKEGVRLEFKDAQLIEFIGESNQTGGYYLTRKAKQKLK
jgi:hypothetical protein